MAAKSLTILCLIVPLVGSCKLRSTLSDAERNRQYYEREYTEETITSNPMESLPRPSSLIAVKSWANATFGDLSSSRFEELKSDVPFYPGPLKIWSRAQQAFPFLTRDGENSYQVLNEYEFEIQYRYHGNDSHARRVFARPLRYRLMVHAAPRLSRMFQILVNYNFYERNPQNEYDKSCLQLRKDQISYRLNPDFRGAMDQKYGRKFVCKDEQARLNGFGPGAEQNASFLSANKVETRPCCFSTDAVTPIFSQPFSWATQTSGPQNPFFLYHAGASTLFAKVGTPRDLWGMQNVMPQEFERYQPPEASENPDNALAAMLGGQQPGSQQRAEPFCEQFKSVGSFSTLSRKPSQAQQGPTALPGFGNVGATTRVVYTRALGFIQANAPRLSNGRFDMRPLDLLAPLAPDVNDNNLKPEFLQGHMQNIEALFQGLPQKQAGGAGGAGGSGGAGGEQQAPQRRKSEQNVLADERAYNLSGDQIERILPAEKIQGFKQYMANQEKMMRQPPPVAESPASADEAEEKEDFGYAEQYLSDLVAGQKRDLDFIRVNVRPDGFLVNLYANEGEYFCAHSVHPAVPFARFVGSSGRRATQVIEAFATAFFEQQNEAHKSILGIDRIDWVRERLATGQSRVKRILVPVKDLERK